MGINPPSHYLRKSIFSFLIIIKIQGAGGCQELEELERVLESVSRFKSGLRENVNSKNLVHEFYLGL